MSACTLALLEVERGSEREIRKTLKALPGVVFVDRIRGPYQFLVGLASAEQGAPHDIDGLLGVKRATLLQTSRDGCACSIARLAG